MDLKRFKIFVASLIFSSTNVLPLKNIAHYIRIHRNCQEKLYILFRILVWTSMPLPFLSGEYASLLLYLLQEFDHSIGPMLFLLGVKGSRVPCLRQEEESGNLKILITRTLEPENPCLPVGRLEP